LALFWALNDISVKLADIIKVGIIKYVKIGCIGCAYGFDEKVKLVELIE
jgi:hypothetical protein